MAGSAVSGVPPSLGGLPVPPPLHTPTLPTHARNRQDPSKLCVLFASVALTMDFEPVSASIGTDISPVWRPESLDASHIHRMGPLYEKPDR